jgi:hypothetical protein
MSRRRGRKTGSSDFADRLKWIDSFFHGTSDVHRTMRGLVVKFDRAKIPYAVVGGMAVNAHGHHQTTDDVDVLLTPEGFVRFEELVGEGNYDLQSGRKRRFRDRVTGVSVDFVIAGTRPGWLRPSFVVYPDPAAVTEVIDGVCYVNLRTLVELKLAIGRYRDLGDVAALIAVHNLDETFTEQLEPSLRPLYLLCLEQKRREDEFEARS